MKQDLLKRLGLRLGHYTDKDNLTGTTVFIAEAGAEMGIDVRGSSTGTLNTAAYETRSAVKLAYGVVLTGGSLYGLETAFGLMQYLEENDIGTKMRVGLVPGVTGAVIYDLAVGNKDVRPSKKDGYAAAQKASFDCFEQGNVGVGCGATVGKWFGGKRMKGGFGIGVAESMEEILVAAFVVTNSVGDIVNPQTGSFYSESGQQVGGSKALARHVRNMKGLVAVPPVNTTLAVIATNAALNRGQLMKVAELTQDGFARAIYPVHTNSDGDVVFALSSLSGERKELAGVVESTTVDLIGLAAQEAIVKAINNSIKHATAIAGFPAYGNDSTSDTNQLTR